MSKNVTRKTKLRKRMTALCYKRFSKQTKKTTEDKTEIKLVAKFAEEVDKKTGEVTKVKIVEFPAHELGYAELDNYRPKCGDFHNETLGFFMNNLTTINRLETWKYALPTKPKLTIVSRKKAKEIIDSIFEGTPVGLLCDHYLVGSSTLLDMQLNRVDIGIVHKKYSTFKDVKTGQYAEMLFSKEQKPKNSQVFTRCSLAPYLCATGDFEIFEEQRPVIVEIKSCLTKDVNNYVKNKRNLIQTLITMELRNVHKGYLILYSRSNTTPMCFRKEVIITIIRKASYIRENFDSIVTGYINFLETFLKTHEISLETDDKKYFSFCAARALDQAYLMLPNPCETVPLCCKIFGRQDINFTTGTFLHNASDGESDTDSNKSLNKIKIKLKKTNALQNKNEKFLKTRTEHNSSKFSYAVYHGAQLAHRYNKPCGVSADYNKKERFENKEPIELPNNSVIKYTWTAGIAELKDFVTSFVKIKFDI